MLFTIFSVFYVLIAAAMIVLILLQRGDGANAGASFGGGASGTVFGARGSASFLTRATSALAALFFVLSLAMGIYLGHAGNRKPQQNLGVMAGAASSSAPASSASASPAQSGSVNAAARHEAPAARPSTPAAAPAQNTEVPQATPVRRQSAGAPGTSAKPAPSKSAKPPASGGGNRGRDG
jgi:preprotein translocase subunit SecG